MAVADAGQTTENAGVTVDVLANDTDDDAGTSLSLVSVALVSMTVDAGGAAITPGSAGVSFLGGQVTFNPGSDFDFLAEGETATVVISYSVQDDAATPLTDTGSLTIHVTGSNDRPVATVDTGSTTENSAVAVDVIANDRDPDTGDALRVSAATVLTMTADANGSAIALSSASVSFSGNQVIFNPGSDFDFLANGETATVVIEYSATDDASGSLSDNSTLTLQIKWHQ